MPQNHPSIRLFLIVFAALLALLALTVGVAYVELGRLGVLAALTIATMKALLVVLYFMHVRYSSRLTWLFVIGGFLWLVILFVLTASDVGMRESAPEAPSLSSQPSEGIISD